MDIARTDIAWEPPPVRQYDYYVSGPMTGIPGHNFPAFFAAAERIKSLGHSVCNPAKLGAFEGWEWADYLRRDLLHMMFAKKVAVLRGWQKSRGARLEVACARALGMPVVDAETLLPWGENPDTWQGKVIGLWGVAKAGKDTIASHLLPQWQRAAHADELKADLAVFQQNHVSGELTPELKEVLRDVYVAAGRAGRALDPDVWIKRLWLPPDYAVITDVRYLNEMQWIWSKGGLVFEVHRPGQTYANYEERRSFEEAREYLDRNKIVTPTILNTGGRAFNAADDVRHIAQQHFMRAA